MKLHVLGSGSRGNCAIIESPTTSLMIDCGLTRKAQKTRMSDLAVDEGKIRALLVTHEHNDHVKGLGVCLRGMHCEGEMPIYCTAGTRENTRYLATYENFSKIKAGDSLTIGDIRVDVFNTSHDVAEPVGFRFTYVGDQPDGSSKIIGYMTDSGICTPMALEMLSGCNLLALETNHDLKMLKNGPYPSYLKARIASDKGHLSNNQAEDVLGKLLGNDLRCIIGMHISQENNSPEIPAREIQTLLQKNDHGAKVVIAGQNIPKTVM